MMMANDIWGWMGPKFADICLTVEEKPRIKPEAGKRIRTGIEPRPTKLEAMMLQLDHSGGLNP